MSSVKAGVAYVDIRLGSIEQFKQKLKSEIDNVGAEVAKRVGDDVAKQIGPEGTRAGKTLSGTMSKAFFQDANQSFAGGLRALSQGQFRTFGGLMKQAGVASALGLKSGFESGTKGFVNTFKSLGSKITATGSSISSSVASTFSAIPSHVANAGKAVDAFGKRLGFLSFQLQNFGIIATGAFTAPVAALVGFGAIIGIRTAAQIEQATASLKALTPAGTDVEALIKRLQRLAQQSPIFNSTDVITFTQKMVASGLSVQKVEAFLKGFGNVALTVGADVGKIPFALEALVQMVGKGKVSMEELRLQLGDALPGAMKLVSDGLGITTSKLYEMVKAGELTGEDVVAAFTKLGGTDKYLKGAGAGADTLGAKWQALKESVQTQLGNAFLEHSDEIKKALDDLGPILSDLIKEAGPAFVELVKGFGNLIKKIGELVNWYKNLSPSQKDMVDKLGLILIAIGPVVLILGGLGAALAGISALFAVIATPVGLVVLGLIAFGVVAALIINYLKNLYAKGGDFKKGWDALWKSLTELVAPLREEWDKAWVKFKEGFDQIKKAFSSVSTAGGGLVGFFKGLGQVLLAVFGPGIAVVWGIIKGLVASLGDIWKAITSLISGVIKIISGIIIFLTGVFTGDWDKALKGLKLIWDGLWDAIVGTIVNIFKAIINFVKGFVTGIVDFFKWLFDILVGHSIIPDMVNKILEWLKKMVDKGIQFVKNLGKPFVAFYNDYIKPFIDSVKKGADKALEFIMDLPGKIKNGFKSAASWLIDAGKNIINGLIDGVKRMGNTLKNAILDLIPAPVRGIVESALGINSPSKVFAEYGKYTVLGFIRGVEKTSPRMESVVASRFSGLVPATVSPSFGDSRSPVVEQAPRGPALNIENYHTNEKDPRRQSEDWWFLINARGGDV